MHFCLNESLILLYADYKVSLCRDPGHCTCYNFILNHAVCKVYLIIILGITVYSCLNKAMSFKHIQTIPNPPPEHITCYLSEVRVLYFTCLMMHRDTEIVVMRGVVWTKVEGTRYLTKVWSNQDIHLKWNWWMECRNVMFSHKGRETLYIYLVTIRLTVFPLVWNRAESVKTKEKP